MNLADKNDSCKEFRRLLTTATYQRDKQLLKNDCLEQIIFLSLQKNNIFVYKMC